MSDQRSPGEKITAYLSGIPGYASVQMIAAGAQVSEREVRLFLAALEAAGRLDTYGPPASPGFRLRPRP